MLDGTELFDDCLIVDPLERYKGWDRVVGCTSMVTTDQHSLINCSELSLSSSQSSSSVNGPVGLVFAWRATPDWKTH